MDLEAISAEIHQVYCQYYKDVRGDDYWTKGDYSLLDEPTKEADRYMARYVQSKLEALQAENQRLREALHWYADPGNWDYDRDGKDDNRTVFLVDRNNGATIARTALDGVS